MGALTTAVAFKQCAKPTTIAASTMPPDAATLPSPPNIPPWKDGKRPYSVGGNMHSNGQVSRRGSYQNSASSLSRPRFPNIKDLQDQAALLSVDENTPVSIE